MPTLPQILALVLAVLACELITCPTHGAGRVREMDATFALELS